MGFRPRVPFRTVISRLGLDTGLKLVLDAGDIASAASSTPDKWLDTSGNGYDFFRGAVTGADGADPTFNGTPGSLSTGEYWSSDGGDNFTYDTTNETWMQNLHKDNAKLTITAWVWMANAGASNNCICGSNGGAGGVGVGINFLTNSTNTFLMRVLNSSSVLQVGTMTATMGQWNFCAVSLDEAVGANGGFLYLNGTPELFTSTYVGPSAGNASFTMQIGDRGNSNSPMPNTARIAFISMWEGVALTQAQVASIYNATHSMMPKHQPTRFFKRSY